MKEQKIDTHFVIKCDDVKYLSKRQLRALYEILARIASCRMKDNKNPINGYWICNRDEPYANNVLIAILRGEQEKGGE